ncbi:MAG: RNA polymerase sigma factor [Actinomycetota bacterium]|nr:RNA polymerase sigma factor [Actinomycetota bacterium]
MNVERGIEPHFVPLIDDAPPGAQASRADPARAAEFEALLREHDRSVRFVATRIVGGDVDDVLQAAYLKAFRRWSTFRGEAAFGTWLHTIVYRTAIDHVRTTRRRALLHVRSAARDTALSTDEAVGDRLAVEAALARLSVAQRAAVLLVDAQGMSYDEAAVVLGVASGTIASRVHRAHLAMRETLERGST